MAFAIKDWDAAVQALKGARLLVPEDFGLFALATLGTGFISLFSGLGLGNAISSSIEARNRLR